MSNFTPEQLEAAKAAKSPEELVTMAKDAGVEITLEQAKTFVASQKQGELADEELENVAGGGCHHDGWLIVTVGYSCGCFECKHCGGDNTRSSGLISDVHECNVYNGNLKVCCSHCEWCHYESALWLCKNPVKRSH
ncbi:MAG: Nif11-like leader peptide family RiPP precursor [Holophagaceae bacterium]|nr:Nif11-like leader peptide family RiPP precursor [Holophagaceae bacterium]